MALTVFFSGNALSLAVSLFLEKYYVLYTYDSAGNRTTETVSTTSSNTITTYTYNNQNRLTGKTVTLNGATIETNAYVYDNNGNVLTVTKTPYVGGVPQTPTVTTNTYDKLNQLATTATPDGKNLSYTYNGEGVRVTKTVNGVLARYLYEYDQPILELDASGNVTARNIRGVNLISRTIGAQTLYFMYNGHANVTALIDGTGAITASYYYDAFGNIKESTGTTNNPYRYAGYQYDTETGLYYLNARYYDPKIARFMTEDSFRGSMNDPLSLNLYTYCHSEPVMYWVSLVQRIYILCRVQLRIQQESILYFMQVRFTSRKYTYS